MDVDYMLYKALNDLICIRDREDIYEDFEKEILAAEEALRDYKELVLEPCRATRKDIVEGA